MSAAKRVSVELDLRNPRHRRILREILDENEDGAPLEEDKAARAIDLAQETARRNMRRLGFAKP